MGWVLIAFGCGVIAASLALGLWQAEKSYKKSYAKAKEIEKPWSLDGTEEWFQVEQANRSNHNLIELPKEKN